MSISATSGNPPLVKAENLSKRYFLTKALDKVNIDIEKGTIVGLLGPNGSGKSTFLKCITGLVKPTAGRVLIEGREPDVVTKAKVAYLPEVDHLYPWMSVAETIEFVGAFYRDWQPERVQRLLELVNVNPKAQVGRLSRGQRARLKLLLAMARSAPLVLLDEPLSGIDPTSRARILKAIVSEYEAGEQTIILSTHEVAESESIFDKVIFLHKGQVKMAADAEELRQSRGTSIQAMLEEVYA
ncbi:MAG: ABC transporter ATP-binding protein [Firmicutes bacterium]|jgi:ABC-2 type transport system ATP-binding protein|nr:ABC transporter ATP-binding protein [Bacillota bacterium]MDH7494861.1 ABC transporter ATP-binding protein [Bacillota bacterium]